MDKIRRSLSFRRKKKTDKRAQLQQQQSQDAQASSLPIDSLKTSVSEPVALSTSKAEEKHSSTKTESPSQKNVVNSSSTTNIKSQSASSAMKPAHWLEDEKRVKSGTCSFQVKVSCCIYH